MCTKIYKDKEKDNDCTTLLLMTNITKVLGIKLKKGRRTAWKNGGKMRSYIRFIHAVLRTQMLMELAIWKESIKSLIILKNLELT